jgi:uncharacterized protein YecT (DUF1311 family)
MAAAEPVPAGYDCDNAITQHEINACAHLAFLEADKELNAQWAITSEAMKRWDEEYSIDDGRPGYFDTLLAAQRAWLVYRDAQCASEGYLFRGGSGEPMMVYSCLAAMTRERTEQLRALVEYDG